MHTIPYYAAIFSDDKNACSLNLFSNKLCCFDYVELILHIREDFEKVVVVWLIFS